MSTERAPIALSALPALGVDSDAGTFAGITTKPDGTHRAVFLLPEQASGLTWQAALEWAAKQDGELPTRAVASLLYANVKPSLAPKWHWTSEEYNASYAWYCYFLYDNHKRYEGSAVAVRLIPLTA